MILGELSFDVFADRKTALWVLKRLGIVKKTGPTMPDATILLPIFSTPRSEVVAILVVC